MNGEKIKGKILATSHPKKSTQGISVLLPKIPAVSKNQTKMNGISNKPLGITKPIIRKGGGSILDVLELYDNNEVNENKKGGTSKKKNKKGGDVLIESFNNMLKLNENFDDNSEKKHESLGILGGKRK